MVGLGNATGDGRGLGEEAVQYLDKLSIPPLPILPHLSIHVRTASLRRPFNHGLLREEAGALSYDCPFDGADPNRCDSQG